MEEGHAERSWERRVGRRTLAPRVLLQVAAIVVVVVFAYRERRLFTGFTSTMSHLTWYWVLLAFVAELASIPALAEAQLIVLRAGGTKADRWQMNLVTLAGQRRSDVPPRRRGRCRRLRVFEIPAIGGERRGGGVG